MKFQPSNEQVALAATLSRFCKERYLPGCRERYRADPRGFDLPTWRELAGLGLVALALDEPRGGLSGKATDLMVAIGALGAALVADPWLPAMIASQLVGLCATQAQRADWLPRLLSGDSRFTIAFGEPGTGHALETVRTECRRDRGDFILSGEKCVALGDGTEHVVVLTGDAEFGGMNLFVLPPESPGMSVRKFRTADGGVACDIALDEVRVSEAALLARSGVAKEAVEEVLATASIALSAEAMAIMDTALAQTSEHLRTRKQFGVPLSSFQVIQHRMADCSVIVELARGMLLRAAIMRDDASVARRESVRAAFEAKAMTARAARLIAQETVQFHGAIGLTEELWIGKAMKRLLMVAGIFGDERAQTAYCDRLR